MILRDYQQAAVDAVYDHLRSRDDNPCVVLPTGAGKSLVIGKIAADAVNLWNGRVLVLAHVKELLEQNADKIRKLCPDLPVGIYSAGLGRRDTDTPVLVAGIQSVYKRACELDPFDLVVIDECHLISKEGDGMYRQLLNDCRVINPQMRVIGLTATPFRLDSGLVCTPDHFVNHVCYEAGIREMIRNGYLSPLVSKTGATKADFSGLHTRAGEFISDEIESLMVTPDLVAAACDEIVAYTQDRQAVLIFATSVSHGRQVVETLRSRHGIECGFVTGQTPASERDQLLKRFRGDGPGLTFGEPPLKYICNVNVLTTGFDAPKIDCVALLRPTMSPGLLMQMVGRGFRLSPGKRDCLILDFGGNIERHGPIDQIRPPDVDKRGTGVSPVKECPTCQNRIASGYMICPHCDYEFPPPERAGHDSHASNAGVLAGQFADAEYEVIDTIYRVHRKRDADDDAPRTMRVDYMIGLNLWKSEFVCIEHHGFARRKAERWWRERSREPVPTDAAVAVEIADAHGLATCESIVVRSVAGERYDRIIRHVLGPIPEAASANGDFGYDDDEVPF